MHEMSAIAALIPGSASPVVGGTPQPFEAVDPAALERQIADQNLILAETREIPDSVRYFVEELADEAAEAPLDAIYRTDPYLLVSLQRSLIASLRALENPDPGLARRDLRLRLEQLRHVYRDLADSKLIYDDYPAAELVQWMTDTLRVPQGRLAELLGVSNRTLQRWISDSNPTRPTEKDEVNIRKIAGLVAHLRHAMTGSGVVDWFDAPHPGAGGRTPGALLSEPDSLPTLLRLSASTRSALAS
jgi:hypothetical protein